MLSKSGSPSIFRSSFSIVSEKMNVSRLDLVVMLWSIAQQFMGFQRYLRLLKRSNSIHDNSIILLEEVIQKSNKSSLDEL